MKRSVAEASRGVPVLPRVPVNPSRILISATPVMDVPVMVWAPVLKMTVSPDPGTTPPDQFPAVFQSALDDPVQRYVGIVIYSDQDMETTSIRPQETTEVRPA